MQKTKSAGFILLAGIGWGMIGIFARTLQAAGVTSIQITALRCVFTAIAMAIFLLVKDKSLFKIKPGHITYFLGTGIGSIIFFNICYFIAIKLTSLSVAAILLYTAPIIVLIFSAIFMHEKLTAAKITALIVSFCGCCLVCGIVGKADAAISLAGLAAGLASGFGYALYSIIGGFALKKYNSYTVTAYTFFVAAICILPICKPVQLTSILLQTPSLIFYVLLLGFFSTFLPFILYTYGLSHLAAGHAAILASVEPVTASLIGFFVFKEKLSFWGITGIGMVLLAICLLSINIKNKQAAQNATISNSKN